LDAVKGLTEEVDRVSSLILPLTLTEPNAPEFSPDHARTLHDLARYIHEKSYEAMFGLGEKMGDMRHSSYLLDVFLPLDLYLIDLGGGLAPPPKSKKVKPRHVISAPMKAILNGMLDKRLPRFGARPIDVGGLLSVMARHAMENPESDPSFRAPSYALISANYANFAARVGYHFSVVDTYCGFTPNKNYISFLFRGGAADAYRRNRRARTIAAILTEYGFAVRVDRDAVHARVNRTTRDDTVAHLEMIGRLLQFFRQMDAAMTSENAVIWVRDAFLRGDYDLNRLGSARAAEPAKKQSNPKIG
jgi:pyruvate,water dikinase